MKKTLEIITENIMELMDGKIPWRDLLIIKGLGSNYKSPTYFMKLFAEELSALGKPAQPGERLEYVIVKNKDPKREAYLGWKMRTPEIYTERLGTKDEEDVDYMYYIEKVLKNCIEQLWSIGYKEQIDKIEIDNRTEDFKNMIQYIREFRDYKFNDFVENVWLLYKDSPLPENGYDDRYEKTYNKLKEMKEYGTVSLINKARTTYRSGRSVLETRINSEPIKCIVKAYDKDRLWEIITSYLPPEIHSRYAHILYKNVESEPMEIIDIL